MKQLFSSSSQTISSYRKIPRFFNLPAPACYAASLVSNTFPFRRSAIPQVQAEIAVRRATTRKEDDNNLSHRSIICLFTSRAPTLEFLYNPDQCDFAGFMLGAATSRLFFQGGSAGPPQMQQPKVFSRLLVLSVAVWKTSDCMTTDLSRESLLSRMIKFATTIIGRADMD